MVKDLPVVFEYSEEGKQEALEWAKSVGRLDELNALRSIYESEGWNLVKQCNIWHEKMRKEGKL